MLNYQVIECTDLWEMLESMKAHIRAHPHELASVDDPEAGKIGFRTRDSRFGDATRDPDHKWWKLPQSLISETDFSRDPVVAKLITTHYGRRYLAEYVFYQVGTYL